MLDGQADKLVDVKFAVPCQTVLSVNAYLIEGQRLGHGLITYHLTLFTFHYSYLCRYRVAVGGGVVADDIPAYLIYSTYGVDGGVGLGIFGGFRCVKPFHLAVLSLAVGVFHPQLVGQSRGVAYR